jgi:hypothetical protein
MIELRWVIKKNTALDNEKVLQYRQLIFEFTGGGRLINPHSIRWTAWKDVLTVSTTTDTY